MGNSVCMSWGLKISSWEVQYSHSAAGDVPWSSAAHLVACPAGKYDISHLPFGPSSWVSIKGKTNRVSQETKSRALPKRRHTVLVSYIKNIFSICSKGSENASPSLWPVPGRGREAHLGMPTSILKTLFTYIEIKISLPEVSAETVLSKMPISTHRAIWTRQNSRHLELGYQPNPKLLMCAVDNSNNLFITWTGIHNLPCGLVASFVLPNISLKLPVGAGRADAVDSQRCHSTNTPYYSLHCRLHPDSYILVHMSW